MAAKRWNLGEFVLCLDLYLRYGAVGSNREEVKEVAALLGRSPASVALRLANFQFVDPARKGPGMSGGERDCLPVWEALANEPALLSQLVAVSKQLLK